MPKIETLHQFKVLIDKLNSLDANHIFRGQSNALWPLQPSAFRVAELRKRADKYPVRENETTKWKKSDKISEIIRGWTSGIIQNGVILNHRDEIIISNLFKLLLIVMQYNFDLTSYWSNIPTKGLLCEKDKKLIGIREPNFWHEESTFVNYFNHTYPQLIDRFDLNGKLLSKSCLEEELTGLDETFPQHYGLSTACLDWSSDPLVALYFGLDQQFKRDSNSGLYLPFKERAQKPADCFSLFAYKQLKQDSPVIIMEQQKPTNNSRAKAQKGTFTYFTQPCLFYLLKGKFPSVDYYVQRSCYKEIPFELQKFNIKYSKEIVDYIENLLEEKKITESSLLLDH